MIYLSAKQISEQYGYCMKTARTLISEIREWRDKGRYPPESILDGCGVRVKADVVTDYLYHRRALRDPIAKQYVEAYHE